MVQRWTPDTCNCILLINNDYTEMLDWEQKCAEHKKVPDKKLFSEVKKTNRKYGFEDNYQYTEDEMLAKAEEKLKAKEKNRKKGKIEINSEINKKLTKRK